MWTICDVQPFLLLPTVLYLRLLFRKLFMVGPYLLSLSQANSTDWYLPDIGITKPRAWSHNPQFWIIGVPKLRLEWRSWSGDGSPLLRMPTMPGWTSAFDNQERVDISN